MKKSDMYAIFNGGWWNGFYYTWNDGMIWSTRYTIKQNKWKAKRRRKENLTKVKFGEITLCPKCDGYGFINYSFHLDICVHCNGSGLLDWISRIRYKEK